MKTKETPESLAEDILRLSGNTLIVKLRFMDIAVCSLRYGRYDGTAATDGEFIYFEPVFILKKYKNEKNSINRLYLHMILHCVFGHSFVSKNIDTDLWDLACDIAVENIINEFNTECFEIKASAVQRMEIEELRKSVNVITAEKLYRYFADGNSEKRKLEYFRKLFGADDHLLWYRYKNNSSGESESEGNKEKTKKKRKTKKPSADKTDKEKINGSGRNENRENIAEDTSNDEKESKDKNEDKTNTDMSGTGTDGENSSSGKNGESSKIPYDDENSGSGEMPYDDENSSDTSEENTAAGADDRISEIWKDISERIQTDLETFGKKQGDRAGSLMQNLREVNREKYDYTSFLKKFSILGEAMKINDDEFDYIFYTYGLSVYGNVPLIDPLEYKEMKKIREFAIAIDTSGSVRGDTVQRFIQKTYNILRSEENFFRKINLHIIQCDADIQQDVKITSQKEFDEYIKNMTLYGFGGTDFRPIFRYVDELIEKKEFKNLKGLIYFTDGCGIFPAKKPDYSTAFVFIDDDYNNYDIPVWAIKLILSKDEI